MKKMISKIGAMTVATMLMFGTGATAFADSSINNNYVGTGRTSGLDVPMVPLIRKGTAIPTKEIGPAKAVTQADSRLDRVMRAIRKILMFTPRLRA